MAKEIEKAYQTAKERGERMVLATLVRHRGSSFRDVGDQMAFTEKGEAIGTLGKCLERPLWEKGEALLTRNHKGEEVELLSFSFEDENDSFWELGLGCGSQWEILLEVLPRSHAANEPLLDSSGEESLEGTVKEQAEYEAECIHWDYIDFG
ncbi:MAG: hypothetical protein D6785_00690, partial [Planctomycetota bacterium]